MTSTDKYFIFSLEGRRFALQLECVKQVLRSMEYTQVPDAPDFLQGLIVVKGKSLPLVNLRKKFGLSEKEISLEDRIVWAESGFRQIAFAVDEVKGVLNISEEELDKGQELLLEAEHAVQGVAYLEDSTVLIYNLHALLSDWEKEQIIGLEEKI